MSDGVLCGECLAQGFRDVGHLVEGGGSFFVEPFGELFSYEFLCPHGECYGGELFECFA